MLSEQEFLRLLAAEEGRMYRIALAITGQDADAWDALQDAVEAAVRHRRQLAGGAAAFPAWLRRIVVNRSLNVLRARGRVIPLDPAGAALDAALEPLPPPADGAADRAVWQLVAELEPGQRQVVALRYLGDLPLEEIARQLDLPLGTVKSRLHRALGRLRELMATDQRRALP